jgi:hypothetical protein
VFITYVKDAHAADVGENHEKIRMETNCPGNRTILSTPPLCKLDKSPSHFKSDSKTFFKVSFLKESHI